MSASHPPIAKPDPEAGRPVSDLPGMKVPLSKRAAVKRALWSGCIAALFIVLMDQPQPLPRSIISFLITLSAIFLATWFILQATIKRCKVLVNADGIRMLNGSTPIWQFRWDEVLTAKHEFLGAGTVKVQIMNRALAVKVPILLLDPESTRTAVNQFAPASNPFRILINSGKP